LHELRFFGRWRSPQLTKKINGSGKRKLRSAEAGDEVSAADAAALFESLEHIVDGAESTGDVFRGDGLAEENAVTIEQVQSEGVAGLGGCGTEICV
jgi:hypothetical protein